MEILRELSEIESEEDLECLPSCAWIFVAVALLPHLVSLAGQDVLTKLTSSICFPISMGPFAFIHLHFVESRLGFEAHMAWISALLISLVWFPIIRWGVSKNRAKTLVFCGVFIVIFAGKIWL